MGGGDGFMGFTLNVPEAKLMERAPLRKMAGPTQRISAKSELHESSRDWSANVWLRAR